MIFFFCLCFCEIIDSELKVDSECVVLINLLKEESMRLVKCWEQGEYIEKWSTSIVLEMMANKENKDVKLFLKYYFSACLRSLCEGDRISIIS